MTTMKMSHRSQEPRQLGAFLAVQTLQGVRLVN